jgi:hypothetical protein
MSSISSDQLIEHGPIPVLTLYKALGLPLNEEDANIDPKYKKDWLNVLWLKIVMAVGIAKCKSQLTILETPELVALEKAGVNESSNIEKKIKENNEKSHPIHKNIEYLTNSTARPDFPVLNKEDYVYTPETNIISEINNIEAFILDNIKSIYHGKSIAFLALKCHEKFEEKGIPISKEDVYKTIVTMGIRDGIPLTIDSERFCHEIPNHIFTKGAISDGELLEVWKMFSPSLRHCPNFYKCVDIVKHYPKWEHLKSRTSLAIDTVCQLIRKRLL